MAAGTALGVTVAVPLAAAGWVAFGVAGAHPNPIWGTLLWTLSSGALALGVAAPTGPGRRTRIVVGVIVAAVWFGLGRFVYGP